MPHTVNVLAGAHLNQPALVLGTGPSAREQPQLVAELCEKMVTIGINRAYCVLPTKLTYFITADNMWKALPAKCPDSHSKLLRWFAQWCRSTGNTQWSMEQWLQAYRDELKPHVDDECYRYYELVSPFAPFVRIINARSAGSCPCSHVSFKADRGKRTPLFAKSDGHLMMMGNSGHCAINFAALIGCNPIFLLGLDLSNPDPKKAPWEQGAVYNRPTIVRGYDILHRSFARYTNIYNLSMISTLKQWPKVHKDQALELIKRAKQPTPSPLLSELSKHSRVGRPA